jgi:SAM-dependent methyltransferase
MAGRTILALAALVLAGCTAAETPGSSPQQAASSAPLREPDVPYEPSPHQVVRQMLELAQVGPNDIVYDLGSGDGRIPIAAARDFGARGVGIDLNPRLVARAIDNAREAGVSGRVTFRNEDLFEAKISEATVVTLFLWPEINLKLRPKLFADLRPGTRIVSYWHDMGSWKPEKTLRAGRSHIYLWRIPADPIEGVIGQ